eukprot:4723570-Pyramimonas_sp.AAC.1
MSRSAQFGAHSGGPLGAHSGPTRGTQSLLTFPARQTAGAVSSCSTACLACGTKAGPAAALSKSSSNRRSSAKRMCGSRSNATHPPTTPSTTGMCSCSTAAPHLRRSEPCDRQ